MKLELQDHNDLNDVNANKYEMYSGLEFVFWCPKINVTRLDVNELTEEIKYSN
jgi:hypothetical protein